MVQFEKHDCCCCSNPFVAIQEWVILNEVKQVGGSHVKQSRMQPLPAEGRSRLGHRGLKQSDITHSQSTAIPSDLVFVNGDNVFAR